MRFEWHEDKALENAKKHRVLFEQAQQVFDDPRQFPLRIWSIPLVTKLGT